MVGGPSGAMLKAAYLVAGSPMLLGVTTGKEAAMSSQFIRGQTRDKPTS